MKTNFNIFTGGSTGILKGLFVGHSKEVVQNFSDKPDKASEISCLEWGDDDEKDILVGMTSGIIHRYNTASNDRVVQYSPDEKMGSVTGLGRVDGTIVVGYEAGKVLIIGPSNEDSKSVDVINALNRGETLCRMKQNTNNRQFVATGGKENDLQIWDLTKTDQPIFKAKNVRPNFLQLRVPVWISDIDFILNSNNVVLCTKHGHVRLYDVRSNASQKRPVISLAADEQPFTAIASIPGMKVVAGSSRGFMCSVDLRKPQKGKNFKIDQTLVPLRTYKGFSGSVKQIKVCNSGDLFASVGLDRHLKLHSIESKIPLHKIYLKSRLNSVLLRSNFNMVADSSDNDGDIVELNEKECAAIDDDDLWNKMQPIDQMIDTGKRKRKDVEIVGRVSVKSKKKK